VFNSVKCSQDIRFSRQVAEEPPHPRGSTVRYNGDSSLIVIEGEAVHQVEEGTFDLVEVFLAYVARRVDQEYHVRLSLTAYSQ